MGDGSIYIDARVRRDRAEDDLKVLKAEVKSTMKEIESQQEKIDTADSDTHFSEDLEKAKAAAAETAEQLQKVQEAWEALTAGQSTDDLKQQIEEVSEKAAQTAAQLKELKGAAAIAGNEEYMAAMQDPRNAAWQQSDAGQLAAALAADPDKLTQAQQEIQRLAELYAQQQTTLQELTGTLQERQQKEEAFVEQQGLLNTQLEQQTEAVKAAEKEYQAHTSEIEQMTAHKEALIQKLQEEKTAVDEAAAAYYAEVDAVKEAEAAAKGKAAASQPASTGQKGALPPAGSNTADSFSASLQALSEAVTGSFAGETAQSKEAAEETKSHWRGVLDTVSGFFKKIGSVGASAFSKVTAAAAALGKKLLPNTEALHSFGTRLNRIVSGALIFNGISSALRSLTSYLGTTLTGTTQVQSALANLQGAAATAAAPLVQVLAPALAAIANAAATAFSYISRLVSFFTGKSVSSAAAAARSLSSVGSAASSTSEEVDKATKSMAGFDEITTLSAPQEDAANSGGGANSLLPNYDFTGTSPFLDSILDAIKAGDWEQAGALVAEKLNGAMAAIDWTPIDATVSGWASNIARALNGFVGALDWGLLGTTLANGLNVGLHAVDTFFQTFDWSTLGSGLGDGLNSLFGALDWESLGRVLTDKLRAMLETLHGFLLVFDWAALGTDVATACMAAFRNVDWVQAAGDLSTAAAGILAALTAWVQGIDWTQLGTTAVDCLLAIDWAGLLLGLLDFIGTTLLSLGAFLVAIWEELGNQVSNGLLDGILQGLRDIGGWLKTNLVDPLVNNVKDFLGIHSPSTVFAEIGTYLVAGLLNGLVGSWGTIPGFFTTQLEKILQLISTAWQTAQNVTASLWSSIAQTLSSCLNGIRDTIRGAINGIIGMMNGLLSGATNMVNGLIDILNQFSISVPDWDIFGSLAGQTFGFNLSKVSAPQIPYLAQGAVIPPNREFLAVLGDQSHGTNVEAPLATIEQAVADVMGDNIAAMMAGFEALRDELAALRGDVQGIQIGDETIGRMGNSYNHRLAMMQGG